MNQGLEGKNWPWPNKLDPIFIEAETRHLLARADGEPIFIAADEVVIGLWPAVALF